LFNRLSKLSELDLSANQITKIGKDTFNGLSNLLKLDLHSNKIIKLDKEFLMD
jgi:Leucine-rich repeat (LRR) protein